MTVPGMRSWAEYDATGSQVSAAKPSWTRAAFPSTRSVDGATLACD